MKHFALSLVIAALALEPAAADPCFQQFAPRRVIRHSQPQSYRVVEKIVEQPYIAKQQIEHFFVGASPAGYNALQVAQYGQVQRSIQRVRDQLSELVEYAQEYQQQYSQQQSYAQQPAYAPPQQQGYAQNGYAQQNGYGQQQNGYGQQQQYAPPPQQQAYGYQQQQQHAPQNGYQDQQQYAPQQACPTCHPQQQHQPHECPTCQAPPVTFAGNGQYNGQGGQQPGGQHNGVPPGAVAQTLPPPHPRSQWMTKQACAKCHTGGDAKGGFAIENLPHMSPEERLGVMQQVLSGEMPKDGPPLNDQQLRQLTTEILSLSEQQELLNRLRQEQNGGTL